MFTNFKSAMLLLVLIPVSIFAQLGFDLPIEDGINFPQTLVGDTSAIELTIIGTEEIEGHGIVEIELITEQGEDLFFSVDTDSFRIEPDERVPVEISFNPAEEGNFEAELTFHYFLQDGDDPNIEYCFAITGEGIIPVIEVDPMMLEFWYITGDRFIDDFVEDRLTIRNVGTGILRIEQIEADVEWLQIEPEELAIEADDGTLVTISVIDAEDFELDEYEANILIHSNDPENEIIEIEVSFIRDLGIEWPRWPPWPDRVSHSIIIQEAEIEGELLERGDEIGVFTRDGILAGLARIGEEEDLFPLGVAAFGDDPEDNIIDGFVEDEPLSFRIWDRSEDIEYAAIAEYAEGPEVWHGDALSVISSLTALMPVREQTILLRRGWNMISAACDFDEQFVDEEGPDMQLIFADVMDELIIIKDEHGRFCSPDFDFWGIPFWNTEKGYQVKVRSETEFEFFGGMIPYDRPIELNTGWNIIAYYPDYDADFEIACENIIDHVILAKDCDGRFWAGGWGWVTFTMLLGGGYQVKVDEDCRLIYPLELQENDVINDMPSDNPVHFRRAQNTGVNMSILITGMNGVELQEGAEISCIGSAGDIAGAVRLDGSSPWGMAIWGDDPTTSERDGLTEGEALRFVYWDPVSDYEYNVDIRAIEGEPVYLSNGYLVIDMMLEVNEPDAPVRLGFALKEIYPNPFNSRAVVEYSVALRGEVHLGLFDLNGQLIKVLDSGVKQSGKHSVELDGSDFTTGLYFIRLQSRNRNEIQRVVILK